MTDPLDQLAELWRWFADGIMAGYCPVYDVIARSVADDRELLSLPISNKRWQNDVLQRSEFR